MHTTHDNMYIVERNSRTNLLVVTPWVEGRIARDIWNLPICGKARGKRRKILLGDADFDEAIRKFRLELFDAGRFGKISRERDDTRIRLRRLYQPFSESVARGRSIGILEYIFFELQIGIQHTDCRCMIVF